MKSSLAALMLLAASALVSSAATTFAKTYYVAPLGAVLTCSTDGTLACPFASIDKAFASKKIISGDVMLLMDGNFGGLDKINSAFTVPVTIQSMNGKNAHLSYVHFDAAAKNIRLKNLTIWREDTDANTAFLIRAYDGSSYLSFENLELRSRADATNYLKWSTAHWLSVATLGMDLRGQYFTVRGCTLTGVSGGIYMASNALVEANVIDGFYQDGLKGVSNSTFRGNVVKNAVNADPAYHSDGFQSYSSSGLVSNLVLENNTILQWANDPASPLKGSLEGIGMFDGWYDNIIIRNNLVVTDHYHGISVYGTRGAVIVNNTVVDLSGKPNTSPWIKVDPKKDGSPSQNVLLANNLAMSISVTADPAHGIVLTKNSVILDPAQVFTDLKTFNYRPKATSGYLDTADSASAPPTDILGIVRPSGAGPDRGAYEITTGATKGTTGMSSGVSTGATTPSVVTGGNGAKFVTPPQK